MDKRRLLCLMIKIAKKDYRAKREKKKAGINPAFLCGLLHDEEGTRIV